MERLLRPGRCPLCEAERQAGDERLDMLLYENVTDPGVRAELRASGGWCGHHFQRAMAIARGAGQTAGVALLYADVLEAAAARPPRRGRPCCGICCLAATAGRTAASQLAAVLDSSELDQEFTASGPVCLAHLPLVQALPAGRGRERLLQPAPASMAEVAAGLQDYFRRQSYDWHGDKSDQGVMARLGQLVQGGYPGATANQCRDREARVSWYRRLGRLR
jgi:hypothetical protein